MLGNYWLERKVVADRFPIGMPVIITGLFVKSKGIVVGYGWNRKSPIVWYVQVNVGKDNYFYNLSELVEDV